MSPSRRRRQLALTLLFAAIVLLASLVTTGGVIPTTFYTSTTELDSTRPPPPNKASLPIVGIPTTIVVPLSGLETIIAGPTPSSEGWTGGSAAHPKAPSSGNSNLLPFGIDYQPPTVNALLTFHMAETVKEVDRYVNSGPYRSRRANSALGRLGDTLPTMNATATTANTIMWPAVASSHYVRWVNEDGTGSGGSEFGTCPALLDRDRLEVSSLIQTATNTGDPSEPSSPPRFDGFGFTSLFYEYPTYNLPWYYHAPMPLCGRFLLRWMETRQNATRGGAAAVPSASGALGTLRSMGMAAVAKSPRLFAFGKRGEMDRNFLPKYGDLRGLLSDPVLTQRNVHRVMVVGAPPSPTPSTNAKLAGLPMVDIKARQFVKGVFLVENCGGGGGPRYFGPPAGEGGEEDDVLIMARLAGPLQIVGAKVVPTRRLKFPSVRYDIEFISPPFLDPTLHHSATGNPNEYVLEVRYVHLNGTDGDWHNPYPLGTIGIRANDHGRKGFKYNIQCDMQRHIYGSPLVVRVGEEKASSTGGSDALVSASASSPLPPQCTRADHVEGRWVAYPPTNPQSVLTSPNYIGNPTWMADAAGLNGNLLWVPTGCRYTFWNPPSGPTLPCIRKSGADTRSRALLLVGDSVTREYAKSCMQFDLNKAKLVCVFNNIALEGQHYTTSYAKAVIDNILDAIVREKASVFATNLGIHHMIGPCYTKHWREFVQLFASEFQGRLARKAFDITITSGSTNVSEGVRAAVAGGAGGVPFVVEHLIWIGSPAVHYARRGMGYQRGVEWDEIAWEALQPLGFKRVNAHAPTVSRQEGTWDGLHYAAERGKVQTPWRNKQAPVRSWNGGVSSMLFTMFLNLVCFGE